MTFGKQLTYLSLYLFIIMMINIKQVENKFNLRKFGIPFPQKNSLKLSLASRLKEFKDKIELDRKRKKMMKK